MTFNKNVMILNISGLGIVFYSRASAEHIVEGSNYLKSNYTTASQVQRHIQEGSIVGFGTGSPGRFILRFHSGYPEERQLQKCRFKLRLGLRCEGGLVCFRDLYDLMRWSKSCPSEQSLAVDDGIYHITLCSELPPSGILGDDQMIDFYMNRLDVFPRLAQQGIPALCS